ncbi:hypothetical protein [Pseudomonas sp. 2995-3]|uniref:hypothetical protein n=1 Tax=Pseudomonas sp. 2995-3 TaxID=1712680 RepID=UPI00117A1CBD|nr:hypothetical protein [Pseudomonas sp. 2995-3]
MKTEMQRQNKDTIDTSYSSPAFYVRQIKKTIKLWELSRISALSDPIFSFFSGSEVTAKSAKLNPDHIQMLLDSRVHRQLNREPDILLYWIEIIFLYFREMAACPQLARQIWWPCWHILYYCAPLGERTLNAKIQMASWANFYDLEQKNISLNHIKNMHLHNKYDRVMRALFLSGAINKGEPDFIYNVEYAFYNSDMLPPFLRFQAHINHYAEVNSSRESLNDILSILNWKELLKYRETKMGLLQPVILKLINNNNYIDLLVLTRILKSNFDFENFWCSHAFLFPNTPSAVVALSNSDKITLPKSDNAQSYLKLINAANRLNATSISLLGEDNLTTDIEVDRFGCPIIGDSLDELRTSVIDHYGLDDDVYQEFNLMTLMPSHNHPVQSALCSLNVTPPIISVSMENLLDEPEKKKFVFMLSSSTFTFESERSFIEGQFGNDANIVIDPKIKKFLELFKDQTNTHFYISAHGNYDHWAPEVAHIHFSDTRKIPLAVLKSATNRANHRRTIHLNICDGATSELSFNPYNSGISAALAHGNQVIISHLWPIRPLYAFISGVLLLKFLQDFSAAEAVRETYSILKKSNASIQEHIKSFGEPFNPVREAIQNTEIDISEFRNIGSFAIYA